jgi:cytochrome c peroxidase
MRLAPMLWLLGVLACDASGASEDAAVRATPDAAPSVCADGGSPLTAVSLEDAVGARSLDTWALPCDGPRGLIAVRVVAPWCGSCVQLLSAGSTHSHGVRFVDALVANAENAEPDRSALRAHALVAGAAEDVLLDPDGRLLTPFPQRVALPLVLIFDARTLALVDTLSGATPEALDTALARNLGEALPVSPALVDGRFQPSSWALLRKMAFRSLTLPGAPALTGDARAVAVGKALFFDPALSPQGVACGSCHQREHGLASADPTAAQGVGAASRNVPGLGYAAYLRSQFWDGRADSLQMQAAMPFENPAEMAASRAFVLRAVSQRYADDYTALFGPLPAGISDTRRFPDDAKPSTASWTAMAEPDRAALTSAFGNVALALVAFERALPRAPTRFDAYLDGELSALSEREKDGLAAFVRAGCVQCHHGPTLSDGAFHNLRSATGRHDLSPDAGRAEGVRLLVAAERFGEPVPDDAPRAPTPAMLGAFRTPPLRDVASTSPYGHGGGYASLRHVLELHRRGGEPDTSRLAVGRAERWLAPFDEAERDALVAFLSVLGATPVP